MINLLERLLLAVAILLGLAIGSVATVVTFAFPAGLRSGIPDGAVEADAATHAWLAQQRAASGAVLDAGSYLPAPAESPLRGPRSGAAFQRAVRDVVRNTAPATEPGGARVPGVPWLRREPGVRYQPRRVVPRLVAHQLQSLEGSRAELQRGGGRFVRTDHGDAYQLDWIAPRSHMARSGLQPGDQVLAVNGLPVGRSPGAARELFERLRGSTRYTILVLRKGERVVIPLEVER